MHHPHPIIATLVLVAIMVGIGLTLLQALRNGEFGARGRTYIVRRRKQPVQFWMTIAVCSGFLVVGVGYFGRLIWEMVFSP
jgi:hypothetical protein